MKILTRTMALRRQEAAAGWLLLAWLNSSSDRSYNSACVPASPRLRRVNGEDLPQRISEEDETAERIQQKMMLLLLLDLTVGG